MNRWRRDASPEAIRAAIAALAELPGQLDGIRRWEQAERLAEDDDEFDFVLSIGFDERETYERYLEHPAHLGSRPGRRWSGSDP